MNDIVENGRFRPREHICRVLGSNSLLVDFMYTKLKNAIPKMWIERIQDVNYAHDDKTNSQFEGDLYEIRTLDFIRLSSMKSSHFYSLLCDFKKREPAVLTFWEGKLNLVIDFDWRDTLKFKFKTLKNNKIKQLNFKTFHRILPFRYNLCKWKIVNENLCIFCKTAESFVHVLLECPSVKLFWKRIVELIELNFKEKIILNEELLIAGFDFKHANGADINTIVAYAQYAIYLMYMLNYFQGKPYNSFFIWHVFKYELLLDNISDVVSGALGT